MSRALRAEGREAGHVGGIRRKLCWCSKPLFGWSSRAGEVLTIAGAVGSERSEIARVIAGTRKRTLMHGGTVYLSDPPVRYRLPSHSGRARGQSVAEFDPREATQGKIMYAAVH